MSAYLRLDHGPQHCLCSGREGKRISDPTANSGPDGITIGLDGNLWFTEADANQIGRITPQGKVTEFGIPTANSQPLFITIGLDGNLWFTESNVSKIGRITTR